MRHIVLFFTFVSCLWCGAISNPKMDQHGEVGITEVYIATPIDWYIELDGQWCLFDYERQQKPQPTAFPCSSDVYLRIKSTSTSKGIYRARVGFTANQRGVVSQTSLRLTAQQRSQLGSIFLDQNDTVMITMDTSQQVGTSPQTGEIQYWSFPLRAVPAGNSLVAFRHSNYTIGIYATSRKSIGSPGNYTTLYKTTLQNMCGTPLQYVSTSGALNPETDSMGTCLVPISIQDPDTVLEFNDWSTSHPSEKVTISSLPVKYIDTDTLVTKAIKIPVTQYMLKVEDTQHNPIYNISCFKEYDSSRYSQINLWFYRESDIITLPLRIYPSLPVSAICFATNDPNGSGCLGTWTGVYVDTAAVINKTITITPTAISPEHGNNPVINSGVTISALCESSSEVRIVISSPQLFAQASISLYALTGKKIETLNVRMNGSGTSTTLFRFPKGKLHPGKYICRLTIDGYSSISSQFTIH